MMGLIYSVNCICTSKGDPRDLRIPFVIVQMEHIYFF